jgi:thioredoxin reductase (NADPH)
MKDVVILGQGIAGLTSAIYTSRAHLDTLIISGPQKGGQLTLTTEVENFPGFENGVMGTELVTQAKKQAERFGTNFQEGWVTDFYSIDGGYELVLHTGDKVLTKTIIVATGASARWMGIESEETYKGKGVSTCATCDGFFYRGKEIVVVGGGDSAMEEATFLTKFADKVTILHRRDEFRASKVMQKKVFDNPKIDVKWNVQISEVLGDGQKVTGVKLQSTVDDAESEFTCDGIFLAIGHIPNTKFVEGKLDLDSHGYLIVDGNYHTKLPGVFGAGDVHDTKYRQAITAAGAGCAAALEAERFISGGGHDSED